MSMVSKDYGRWCAPTYVPIVACKVYLRLYLAHIEFQPNHRDLNDWALLIEMLVQGVKANDPRLRRHVWEDPVTKLCPMPGLTAA